MRYPITFLHLLIISYYCHAQVCFKQPAYYPANLQPYCIETCDFNNDGLLDLVSGSIQNKMISIYFGVGQGVFTATPTQYTTGGSPYSITCKDFNADGNIDLAMAIPPYLAKVWFGDGNGAFPQRLSLSTGYCPVSITSGDFDGDNKLDLATANCQGAGLPVGDISVFLNTGSGTFASAIQYTTQGSPYYITCGDLNFDGKADIVSSQTLADKISVFIASGSGSFLAATTLSITDHPSRLEIGDFNNDTKPDVMVAKYYSSSIALYSGDGLGNLQQPYYIPCNPAPSDLTYGDFDLDNIPDVVVANYYVTYGVISFLKGMGSGNYAPPKSFTISTSAHSLTKGDFNGDGLMDIASANYLHDYSQNDISVLLNKPFIFSVQVSPPSICIGDSMSLNINGINSYTWANNYSNGSWITPTVSTVYSVSATNTLGCISDKTIAVNVFVNPTVSISSSTGTVCAGQPVNLYSNGANSYQWSCNCNSNLCTVNPTVSSTYTVVGVNGPCPTDTKTVQIMVNTLPNIQVSTSAYTVCQGSTPTVSVGGAVSYTWSTIYQTVNSGTLVTYNVYGSDSNNCVNSQTLAVLISNCLAINESEFSEKYSIYPLPVQNILHIKSRGAKIDKVAIYDLNGRLILKPELSDTLNLENLSPGLYMLEITSTETVSRSKIVKE